MLSGAKHSSEVEIISSLKIEPICVKLHDVGRIFEEKKKSAVISVNNAASYSYFTVHERSIDERIDDGRWNDCGAACVNAVTAFQIAFPWGLYFQGRYTLLIKTLILVLMQL